MSKEARVEQQANDIPPWERFAVDAGTAAKMMSCGYSTFFKRVKNGIYPPPGPDGLWEVQALREACALDCSPDAMAARAEAAKTVLAALAKARREAASKERQEAAAAAVREAKEARAVTRTTEAAAKEKRAAEVRELESLRPTSVPLGPGVHNLYRHFSSDGRLLYIGISLSAVSRLAGHKHHGSEWFSHISRVDVEGYATREDAALAERIAIQLERPEFNIIYAVRDEPQED